MKMEQDARRLGRQSPEPCPKPKGLGNDDGTECQNIWNQKIMVERWNIFSGKSWKHHSAPELFGQQAPEPGRNQERMMEQGAIRVGRQAPEP